MCVRLSDLGIDCCCCCAYKLVVCSKLDLVADSTEEGLCDDG